MTVFNSQGKLQSYSKLNTTTLLVYRKVVGNPLSLFLKQNAFGKGTATEEQWKFSAKSQATAASPGDFPCSQWCQVRPVCSVYLTGWSEVWTLHHGWVTAALAIWKAVKADEHDPHPFLSFFGWLWGCFFLFSWQLYQVLGNPDNIFLINQMCSSWKFLKGQRQGSEFPGDWQQGPHTIFNCNVSSEETRMMVWRKHMEGPYCVFCSLCFTGQLERPGKLQYTK